MFARQAKTVLGLIFIQIIVSTASEEGCLEECGDFHRICPAIKNPSYLAQFEQEGVKDHLPAREMPEPVNCETPVYKVLCPQSCGLCKPCSQDQLSAVSAQVSQLESELAALKAEVESRGQTTLAPTAERIDIIAGTENGCFGNKPTTWGIEKSLDHLDSTCFISAGDSGGMAKYWIPESTVTSVKVQNRKDCCGERMTGNVVWVCTGTDCLKCGAQGVVGNGQWGEVQCGGNNGIQGTYIKITASNSYLQIAEVQVYGMASAQLSKLNIIKTLQSSTFDTRFDAKLSFDGPSNTLFIAKESAGGWIKYQIPEKTVRIVKVQNRGDCCGERMKGEVVQVCADDTDESCQDCGVFGEIGTGGWGSVECDSGIQGTYVKVSHPTQYVQIAEIQIYATS